MRQVEFTDEFAAWWDTLDEAEQDAVDQGVDLLEESGPALGRPHVDTLKGSKHANMKELRATARNRPLRVLFAFDPRRMAILLIGGDKGGDSRFYERTIPLADKLYDQHLEELKREGLI
ncbi:MAG: type II toxin-antitoxin system RelE/ParE family toxin [Phycisphaeraceae bacterium]